MSYQLLRQEPPDTGLARVFGEMLSDTLEHLQQAGQQRARSVHETRKNFKRMRALLRLIRHDMPIAYQQGNPRIREMSALLSPYRDADAMLETLEHLHERWPTEFDQAAFEGAQSCLQAQRDKLLAQPPGYAQVNQQVIAQLQELAHLSTGWRFEHLHESRLAESLKNRFKRARKAARQAARGKHVEDIHQLRKRVKDLLYLGQILRDCSFGLHSQHLLVLSALASKLGIHHDLAVFENMLGIEDIFPQRDKAAKLLTLALAARISLENQALNDANALLLQGARDFLRHSQ